MNDAHTEVSIAPVMTSVSFILLSFFLYLVANADFDQRRSQETANAIAEQFGRAESEAVPNAPQLPRVIEELFNQRQISVPARLRVTDGGDTAAVLFDRSQVFPGDGTALSPAYQHIFGLFADEMSGRTDRIEILMSADPVQSPVLAGDDQPLRQSLALLALLTKHGLPADRLSASVLHEPACVAVGFICETTDTGDTLAVVLRTQKRIGRSR